MPFLSSLVSPIGNIVIKSNETEVYCVSFEENEETENPNELTLLAKLQLEEYFDLKRTNFDFPFAQSGTPFQQKVWQELVKIEAGNPISYLNLSKRMPNPLAIRAIASANGKNKIAIVVPCHRVIGSSGELVGYAGGLWRKKWLLDHEAKLTGTGQTSLIL
jgi:methylated-DNA-[protein]-cysteine S-methyltransferase